MSHIKWTDIESFHNVRKSIKKYPEILKDNRNNRVLYRAKVKLHGTNAAIQVRSNDIVIAQSRTRFITPGDDNSGFASWVEKNRQAFIDCYESADIGGFVIFGEWIGPGIMKGTACNLLPHPVFAIFSMRLLSAKTEDHLIVEPGHLKGLLRHLPGNNETVIIPWEDLNLPVSFDFMSDDSEKTQQTLDMINEKVLEVEQCDPFLKETFNVSGIGEGLVFYPVSHTGVEYFSNLAFKAKGEKHKVVKTKDAVQLDPEVVSNVESFVELFVTPARLEQGVREISRGELVFDNKLIGPFIGWLSKDVKKESDDELEANGLEWQQVSKPISIAARTWYMEKLKEL